MNIFVVIPLYNEQKNIVDVLNGISSYKLPMVVVDDGSTDKSASLVKKLRSKNLFFLSHKINLGKGAAMKTGAEYSFGKGANAVIFMDSDRQHEAHDLPRFIEKLQEGYDVVFGSRNMSFGVPLVRYLGNKVASFILILLFRIYVSDPICGFRALTRKAYERIKWDSSGYGVETEMVARVGKTRIKHCEVPVETLYHDKTKGVTLLDAFGILASVIKWRLTI